MMQNTQHGARIHETLQQLAGNEPVTVTVQGACMVPLIADKARVQVVRARVYWPGDVVVALSPQNQYLVHRVIGVYRKSGTLKVVTQADSASSPDSAVFVDKVLGRVSGGCCHPHVICVPLSHRLSALGRFFCFSLTFFFKKTF
jgi:hypothetical protein